MKNNTQSRYDIRKHSMFHIFYRQGYGIIKNGTGTIYYIKNYARYLPLYPTYSYYLKILYEEISLS